MNELVNKIQSYEHEGEQNPATPDMMLILIVNEEVPPPAPFQPVDAIWYDCCGQRHGTVLL